MTRNRASRIATARACPAAVPAIAPPGRSAAAAFATALFAASLIAAIVPATAGAQPSDVTRKKLVRQIGVMESIIDQVLVDSPNFFVQSTNDNTRGIYLEEFGVLFSFQASLVNKEWNVQNLTIPQFETRDGKIIIDLDKEREKAQREEEKLERERERLDRERKKHNKGHEDDEETPEPDEDEEAPEANENGDWQKQSILIRQEKTYLRGKAEILETLLDYGDTMTGLRDDQSIGIVGSLRDSEFFNENRISRVLFRVKMRDIRAYTAGQLTEDQAKEKVSEEEY